MRACLPALAFLSLLLVAACAGDEPRPGSPPARADVSSLAANPSLSPGPATPTPTSPPVTTPTPTATATATPTAVPPTPTPVPTRAAPAPAAITVRARDLAFDQASIRVRSGTRVTATLVNGDAGVEHNLTFSLPGLPHGDTCAGPCTASQTFIATTPGSYYFLCTMHSMVGDFIVDP